MTAKKKRHGRPPQAVDEKVAARPEPRDDGYPLLSLRHLQPRFGVEEMARDQRSEFLVTLRDVRCTRDRARLEADVLTSRLQSHNDPHRVTSKDRHDK